MSTGATASQMFSGVSINPDNAITPLTRALEHGKAIPVDGLWHGAELSRPQARLAVAHESAAIPVAPVAMI